MSSSMRALRLHGPQDLRLDTVPVPRLRPGTVKVRVEWNGICGSDLHHYTHPAVPATGFVHPLIGEEGPFVQGHEFSGRVVEVADDVTSVQVGAVGPWSRSCTTGPARRACAASPTCACSSASSG
ncbi:alcohol dehydrogenase catalytic domain-containing protein [Streptomyces finlayi]|nr:alcohol dehydrogenase catalytic domain-containing protein [Streptomyces finlayi]